MVGQDWARRMPVLLYSVLCAAWWAAADAESLCFLLFIVTERRRQSAVGRLARIEKPPSSVFEENGELQGPPKDTQPDTQGKPKAR